MPLNDAIRQRARPLTGALTSNRIMLYAVFSTGAMLAAIANACRNQSNFYAVTVYLSRSGRSLLILANFGFLAALVAGKLMQRIFFGPLQPREVERLYDQTWMFVTESLLAFTIFRDEFDIPFVLMFGFLLFVKCFHWLMSDRIESMDQVTYPGPPLLFHIRLNTLFLTVSVIDASMFLFAVESTLMNGVGGMVLFATEYAILMASAINAMARYTLNNMDYRRARSRGGENAPAWENKSIYVSYIDLVTDFLKLTTYLTFFMIILTYYGLPLNIIRDVYLTARSFVTRLRTLIRYHNATRDMDRRYANATEEELAAMSDRTCIICREELTAAAANNEAAPNGQAQHQDGPNMTPKKLPCGHVFHFQCLRSWLERQQSCPTCRRTVLDTTQPNRNDAQPQQPQANGLRPAPPQPGMAPQEPGQGGGIRWFGRFFGIAAQPQLIPGGFPHGFMPPPPGAAAPGQPAPPPAQQGQVPGQPIPGYGAWPPYPPPPGYLYQPGYPPFPYQYYPPPMYPQLPPNAQVLRGFYGPGGVYYPWPVDQGQGQQQGNQHPGTGPSGSVTSPPPGSSSSTNQTPTPTVPTESNVPRSSSSSTSSSSSMSSTSTELSEPEGTSGEAERSSTPREAAALAALRRFNTLPRVPPTVNGPITRPSAPPPVAPTDSIPVPPSSNPSSQPAQSTDHTQPSSSIGSTSTSSAPTTAPNPDARQDVPSLIPLYDFGNHPGLRHQAAMGGPSSFYRSSPGFGRQQYPSPFGGYTSQQQTSSRSSGHINNHNNTNNNNNNNNNIHNHHQQQNGIYGTLGSRTSPTSRRTPFHQLPTTLTEEQLGRLDRVTREGIDERLRVLENVSGAVYRCIEELTRIRSVLPGVVLAQAQGGGGGEGGQGGGNETGSGRRTEESVSQVGASEPSGSGTVDPGLEIPKDSVTRCGGGGDDDDEEEDEEGRNGAAVDHPLEQDTAAVPSNRNIQVEDASSQAASSSLTGLVPEELSPPES